MSEKKEFEPLDVGATERVDWKVAKGLSKYVHFDENGDAVIGKNLEVGGTTKLNGGLKAIHTFDYVGYTIDIYLEKEDTDFENCFSFIGCVDGLRLIIGSYQIENRNITNLSFLTIGIDGFSEFVNDEYFSIAKTDETQPKLFTHTLTLTADKSYTLIYSSTNNLPVQSVADLRTIMNVMATSDNVILPVCATDLSGTAVLQLTTTLCKIGTANVTAVTDKLTTL